MARDHILMFTLGGILLLNVIAIVLLNNRLADQERLAPVVTATTPTTAPMPSAAPSRNTAPPQPAKPLVGALLLLANRQQCPECFDINQYPQRLNASINMTVENAPAADIPLFRSDRLPVMAFNGTFADYFVPTDDWSAFGYNITIPSGTYAGTWFVLYPLPPYYSTKDSRTHGIVTVTYLTMSGCTECYDAVSSKKTSLDPYNVRVGERRVYDVSSAEGKALIARYNITAVPTIILDKEAGEYAAFMAQFSVVASAEKDGAYVLRDLQSMNVVYYDLAKQKLMKP